MTSPGLNVYFVLTKRAPADIFAVEKKDRKRRDYPQYEKMCVPPRRNKRAHGSFARVNSPEG